MPEEILKYLPILMPILFLGIFSLAFKRLQKSSKVLMSTMAFVEQKIKDFKNTTFRSYEEESRAKQQLRKELSLEIENRIPSGPARKIIQDKIDFL